MVCVPWLEEFLRFLHLQAVQGEARPGDFPVAERLVREILSLPIYLEITEGQITYVCDQLRRALSAARH